MNDEIILHKNQQQFDDLINNYEDENKYKCKTCNSLGATKKIDFVCTNSLSLYYETDVYKVESCIFYKKESLEYDTEYEYGVLDLN